MRPGEIEPLVEITYPNGDNSKSASRVRIHANRLDNTTSVKPVVISNAIKVYPNPIAGDQLNLQLPTQNSGKWTYTILDMTGQTILENSFMSTSVSKRIIIPTTLAKGKYILTLLNNGVPISTNPISKI
mgnify:CR=1 FL=1